MAEATQALAKFWWGHEQEGTSKDGMPQFREILMVTLAVPPLTMIHRRAKDTDLETHAGAYALFEKQQYARSGAIEQIGRASCRERVSECV